MSKFRFKFESVKRVKENIKKKAQKELAQIDLFISKIKVDIKIPISPPKKTSTGK